MNSRIEAAKSQKRLHLKNVTASRKVVPHEHHPYPHQCLVGRAKRCSRRPTSVEYFSRCTLLVAYPDQVAQQLGRDVLQALKKFLSRL
jgi:hypothetical protein